MKHDRRRLVLVVEDDSLVLAVTCSALERAGYDTLSASTHAEALAAATSELAALVVDVVLPRSDGRDLVEELRLSHAQLPAVFVSGHLREIDCPPASVFLPKPFTPAQLRSALESLLGR